MSPEHEALHPTRMLFLGEESLADGFRLIGFETIADPLAEDVDQILKDLVRNREKAFVVVDDRVMGLEAPYLKRVRKEGGRIVVIAVPPLSSPTVLASEVADRLATLFGTNTLGATQAPSGDAT